MMKDYCSRKGDGAGNCESCSLSSYGRDCRNNPVTASVSSDKRTVKDAFLVCGSCLCFDDDFTIEGAAAPKAGDVCPLCGESVVRQLTRREFYRCITGAIIRELFL